MIAPRTPRVLAWWERMPLWLLLPAVALIVAGWWSALGKIEGMLLPVATQARVLSQAPSDGETYITLEFTKARSCTFRGLAVYVLDSAGLIARVPWHTVEAGSPENDRSRPTGEHVAYLRVGTTVPVSQWRMIARHTCHPLYDTVTQLWP